MAEHEALFVEELREILGTASGGLIFHSSC